MKMEWMTLRPQNTRPLQNDFHARIKRQHYHTRTVTHKCIIERHSGVVEGKNRLGRKISSVNPISPAGEIRLQNRRLRQSKRDIINRGSEFRTVGTLTRDVFRTWRSSKSDSEEKFPVDGLWDICREFSIGKRPEFSREIGDEIRVVNCREIGKLSGRSSGGG